MAPTPPPLARAWSVASKIRFFSSALKIRRCALAGTSTSAEMAPTGTAILASLTMVLPAALLCNYGRGKCLIDIGTEGAGRSVFGGPDAVESKTIILFVDLDLSLVLQVPNQKSD